MSQLVGLKGISASAVDCKFIQKAADIYDILESGFAGTAAGDNGAINVWKDDNGNIRVERQRFMRVEDSGTYKTIRGACTWVKKNLKLIK